VMISTTAGPTRAANASSDRLVAPRSSDAAAAVRVRVWAVAGPVVTARSANTAKVRAVVDDKMEGCTRGTTSTSMII
jgi:hypothetical protein